MIMEKELDAACERFGWKTLTVTPNTANVPHNPSPKYPLAARREHMTGTGLFFLEIDTISGAITHVTVWKSPVTQFGRGRGFCFSAVALCAAFSGGSLGPDYF